MITFARYTGTAPGTTAMAFGAFPTQAVWEPDPNQDTIKIAMPPNQWATGPTQMIVKVPKAQRDMGPVPNDLELATTRPYLPVHRGWIEPSTGEPIFRLQGPLGSGETAAKWAIAGSIISAIALSVTTIIAIRREGREAKRRR
jgi:hypothetical protein